MPGRKHITSEVVTMPGRKHITSGVVTMSGRGCNSL